MVARSATLEVRVTGDASGAATALDSVGTGASKFQTGINKAAKVAAIGGAALVAFGTQAFAAASDAQQAAGAVDAVFGKSAKSVHSFAKNSADATGLASSEYENMAATFGAQLKNMGVDSKKLAPTTNELITLGADLAAQFGGSTSDAVAALSSLLRGETDPIERYGVSIKAADVAAKKAEMGLDGLTGAADKQATTQATLALLTEQTASAQGAFAREANTAAGQQARANAKFKDATAALGTALLPVVSKVAEVITKLSGFIRDNALAFQILVGVLGTVAVATWAVNAAMAANPVTLIAVGVAALIAGIVVLVKNWDKVVAVFKKFWNWLKQNWDLLAAIILGPFGVAILAIKRNWKTITRVFSTFGAFAKRVFRAVRDVAVSIAKRVADAFRRFRDVAKAVFTAIRTVARTVFGVIRDVARNVFGAIREAIRRFADVARTVFRAVRDVARTIFQSIRDIARNVFEAIRTAVRFTADVIKSAFRAVRDVVVNIWRAIRDTVRGVLEAIRTAIRSTKDVLNAAWRSIRDVAKKVWDAIKGYIQWPIDKISELVDKIKNTLNPVWSTIKDAALKAFGPIKDGINAIKNAVNWVLDKIPTIHFPKPPSWVPIIGKSAPAPARPVVARVAAPAVPMGRGRASVSTAGGAGAGITINVTGALDPDAVARQIERILYARARRTRGVVTGRPLV